MFESLRTAVLQAEATQKEMVRLTADSTDYDERALVRLRGQFSRELLAISQIAREDKDLQSDPPKHEEFQRRSHQTQDMLSRHQSNWMLHAIDRDWDGYRSETEKLRNAQTEFFTWAKSVL